MFITIGVGFILFVAGYGYGKRSKAKEIENRINVLVSLEDQIKERNNEMVNNIARIYNMVGTDDGEFTEIDALLFDMWMD